MALNPAPVPAAELPPPEETAEEAPRVVMPMLPVLLLAPDPLVLLDVIRTELLVPPEPPDAALSPDPPAPRERSPGGKERTFKESRRPLHYDKLQRSFITFLLKCHHCVFYLISGRQISSKPC